MPLKVLLAGATGYLGGHVARELGRQGFHVRAIARNPKRLAASDVPVDEICEAELTLPQTARNCCQDIDVVISTIGITKQKDGLTYMDVDYKANLNLLHEARSSGVQRFVYVSVLNGENLRDLKICEAKERFVDQLKQSGINYCIIRPNGFFSDMTEFYRMAAKGRVYLFGNGEQRMNPIHGEDLAAVCVNSVSGDETVISIGGPETLTHNDIATLAFKLLRTEPRITHIPNWVRVAILKAVRTLTGSKVYGPIEFFLTVMAIDMVAPEYGTHTLRECFAEHRDTNA